MGRDKRPEFRKVGGFAFAGGIAFIVDASILSLIIGLGMRAEFARLVSFIFAVAVTWYLNRSFTFQTTEKPSLREFFSYLLAMSLGLVLNYAVFVVAINISYLAQNFPALALIPATLAGMIVNFVTSRSILDR